MSPGSTSIQDLRNAPHGDELGRWIGGRAAGALAAIGPKSSWERFILALESDVGDVLRGTPGPSNVRPGGDRRRALRTSTGGKR